MRRTQRSSLLVAVMMAAMGQSVIAEDGEVVALRGQLQKQLSSLTKGQNLATSVLNLGSKDWKTQVLAKDEAFSRVVEVQGKTLLHVGKEFRADRIIVHGDGVVWVDDTVVCPLIDIRGQGMVVFKNNPLNFTGGWILMDSGLVVAKADNQAGVHFRKGGTLLVEKDNHGEVIVSEGKLSLNVGGNQNGDITLKGASDSSALVIGGDLHGFLSSQQDVKLDMQGSIYSNLLGQKSVDVSAKNFLGEWIKVQQVLKAKLNQLGQRDHSLSSVEMGEGNIDVKTSSFANLVAENNLKMKVGEDQLGSVSSLKGNLNLAVGGFCDGDLMAAQNLNLSAQRSRGEIVAGADAVVKVKDSVESYRLDAGKNGTLQCGTFWGNIKVGAKGDLATHVMDRGDFSHSIEMGSGRVAVKNVNELDIVIKDEGQIKIGENRGELKIGGDGQVDVAGTSNKDIVVSKNAQVKVGQAQVGSVFVGGDGQVNIGELTGELEVVKTAKVAIGETKTMEYVDGGITIGQGSVQVKGNNIVAVTSTEAKQVLELTVGGAQKGPLKAAGDLNSKIKEVLEGDVEVAQSWTHSALAQSGDVKVGQLMKAKVAKNWSGDVSVMGAEGESSLSAQQILDSNLWFTSRANVVAQAMLNTDGQDESIRLKGGHIEMARDLQAHLASDGPVVVKAKRIVGDVQVDETSNIDAIVKGRLSF